MRYFRVKQEYDNHPKYEYKGRFPNIRHTGILVGGELYTPTERLRIANTDRFFEEVYISKFKTYWLFGARFEDK